MTKKTRRVAKMRRVLLTLSLVLVVAFAAVGGTVAWLTDKTTSVVNTFTESDVDITLTETTGATYKMVPGATIAKDPTVTVEAGSEACYVFVKLDKSTDKAFDDYLTFAMDSQWTKLTDDVYYLSVSATDAAAGKTYAVLANNQVTVKSNVTKAMMDALSEANYPKLTVTAYAIQSANLTTSDMTEIWGLAQQ